MTNYTDFYSDKYEMKDYTDFSSDKIDIFMLLIDSSGSMRDDVYNVREGLELFRKNFEDFPEANSIAISKCTFDDELCLGKFQPIREFDTYYTAEGATALHYSIVEASKYLRNYVEKVTRKTGIIPKVTFILFSDGEPCMDRCSELEGRVAIEQLNCSGATTVFVAFGDAITSEFGKRLGFMSTIDVVNRNVVTNFLGVELSKSCKEQSMSLKPLGENFFSKANGNSSSYGYSQTAEQALEDDSWINDI